MIANLFLVFMDLQQEGQKVQVMANAAKYVNEDGQESFQDVVRRLGRGDNVGVRAGDKISKIRFL